MEIDPKFGNLCQKIKKRATYLRSGRIPETGCPPDPGPGLGDILSLGLFWAKSSSFFKEIPHFVTRVICAPKMVCFALTRGPAT